VVRARDAKTFALAEREQAAFDTLGKYTRNIQLYNRLEVLVFASPSPSTNADHIPSVAAYQPKRSSLNSTISIFDLELHFPSQLEATSRQA